MNHIVRYLTENRNNNDETILAYSSVTGRRVSSEDLLGMTVGQGNDIVENLNKMQVRIENLEKQKFVRKDECDTIAQEFNELKLRSQIKQFDFSPLTKLEIESKPLGHEEWRIIASESIAVFIQAAIQNLKHYTYDAIDIEAYASDFNKSLIESKIMKIIDSNVKFPLSKEEDLKLMVLVVISIALLRIKSLLVRYDALQHRIEVVCASIFRAEDKALIKKNVRQMNRDFSMRDSK